MTRPLSNDLRERIIGAVEGGMSCNAVAKVYEVAVSAVIKLVQRWKATGSFEAKPMGGYRGHKLSEHTELVQRLVKENLPSHKVSDIREAIEAAGAKLHYLPPYSPDLNPIEQAFSKIKAMLRKTAARSVSTLDKAIARIIRSISPSECAAYLNNSGYLV